MMAECMLKLIKKDGTIIIEVQYLLNTLKNLTFDNIYHEHYNYWSLTSLVTFFNRFKAKIYKAEKISTHGGSLRIYVKKSLKTKIEKSVRSLLTEEKKFGINKYKFKSLIITVEKHKDAKKLANRSKNTIFAVLDGGLVDKKKRFVLNKYGFFSNSTNFLRFYAFLMHF